MYMLSWLGKLNAHQVIARVIESRYNKNNEDLAHVIKAYSNENEVDTASKGCIQKVGVCAFPARRV